ncbi:MAG: chorismate-binding protein [Chryseolinea sp.]
MNRQNVIEDTRYVSNIKHQSLASLINNAVDKQFAVALWRLPQQKVSHLILSKEITKLNRESNLEDLTSGFIFAPFDTTKDRLFLKADYAFSFEGLELTDVDSLPIELVSRSPNKSLANYHRLDTHVPPTDRRSYVSKASNAIQAIENGQMEKVVTSRALTINLSPDFDLVNAFQKLCDSNPDALVSFVSNAESGTWLGATPELLVSVDSNKIFKTIALAGTQHYTPGQNLKGVAWTQKDIEEQALVERYIISCFKMIRLREYDEHGPKTVIAGNLLHLRSDFSVDMQATGFPQLGSAMLRLLHPTSAVCGSPLQPALEFLKKYEGYDRQYYTGYLGPVNFKDQIQIFVNLRCAQLLNQFAIIYAGGGITADSIPEQEWLETEMKLNTLRSVLTHD